MLVKEYYLESVIPQAFDKRLFTYSLLHQKSQRIVVIDDEYLSELRKVSSAVFPAIDHLEMVLTPKNLADSETVDYLAECYMKITKDHIDYVNKQSLSAVLLLLGQMSVHSKGNSPLQVAVELFNSEQGALLNTLKSFHFEGEPKRVQYLTNFVKVASNNLTGFRTALRFLLNIHRCNVLAKDTKTTDVDDLSKDCMIGFTSRSFEVNDLYSKLLINFLSKEIETIYIDAGVHTKIASMLSSTSSSCYIASAGIENNLIDRQLVFSAEAVFVSSFCDSSVILQYLSGKSSGLLDLSEKRLYDHLAALSINKRAGLYLTTNDGIVQSSKVEDGKLLTTELHIAATARQIVKDNQTPPSGSQEDEKLAMEFGFSTDADGWL